MSELSTPLTLPCGATLPNRIAKAAMTEGLAEPDGSPSEALERLYGTWSDGGAGLLITGNVQIDANHLERAGNVVVDGPPDAARRKALARWAAAATRGGNAAWVQLSHAGRQTQRPINPRPKAPSAKRLRIPGGMFGMPEPLSSEEIEELVGRFATAAKAVQEAGFTGVQVHAAHGYLLSQFLSPLANERTDQWGGPLENRARALLESVRAVRREVGPDFAVAVKLNSADFQRGGFAFTDSLQVARWLQEEGVDLIEISGGTYEQPRLLGLQGIEPVQEQAVRASSRAREAYFVDFAQAMRSELTVPLMVTGGLRRRDAMDEVLTSRSADVIGLARPMCVMPDAPKRLLDGLDELPRPERELALLPRALRFLTWFDLVKAIDGFSTQYWYYEQITSMGRTGSPDPGLGVFTASRLQMSAASKWLKARRA
ncbi:MAG: NADH:flavin oxidoreductase/NADH oxidase family protein [Myxococcales bacterium]|nr:NADH:flavin oxidoreductase/NADH oxidase family protein [Myxococcales bacterium]